MADINKVWLSGLVVSQPVLTKLSSKTPFTTFSIQVNEKFKDRNGIIKAKPNIIRIESLGKSAEITASRVKQGGRYTVDGYLRQDIIGEIDQVRVRSFAVYADDSSDHITYKEGLKQALEILRKSRDLESAVERLEDLLKS